MSFLDSLNPEQKSAAGTIDGPLLILAGAGSGKTRVLTFRMAYMIQQRINPRSILAVTFTNKAAKEMAERMDKMLDDTVDRRAKPSMGTFHSICVRILREDIERLAAGWDRNFVIFDTSDAQSLLKQIIKNRGMDDKQIKIRPLLSIFSAIKNHMQSPEEYLQGQYGPLVEAVKQLYPVYQKELRKNNALDFDDLLIQVVSLWEQFDDCLDKYRKRWNYVLVDEYQDTNFVQYRLIQLLVSEHKNLCVVGDDHQSIYSFRGADYRNILDFEKDFPNAKVIQLEQNYRSTKAILANANHVINQNKTGRPKKLWTDNIVGEKIQVLECSNEKEEGGFITQKIEQLKEEYSYNQMAILYRMNAQSRALEESLMRAGIPYQILGGTRFFDRKEIKDAISYLRLIINPRDDVAFQRIINVPSRKLGSATLEVVRQYATDYDIGMYEVLEKALEFEGLPEAKKKVLYQFYQGIAQFRALAATKPVSEILQILLDKTGYLKFLDDGTAEGQSRVENVQELFSVAARYDDTEDSLSAFLEGTSLIAEIDNMQDDSGMVTMMTMHASKGLEFPVVFLPGWEETIFPSSRAESEGNIEEERRLAYVAITRAEERCFITQSKQRMLFGSFEMMAPSRFLDELHPDHHQRDSLRVSFNSAPARPKGDNFSHELLTKAPQSRQEAIFGVEESDYKPGDAIRHDSWGDGKIIQVKGDNLMVAFPGKGIKTVVASAAPIVKI